MGSRSSAAALSPCPRRLCPQGHGAGIARPSRQAASRPGTGAVVLSSSGAQGKPQAIRSQSGSPAPCCPCPGCSERSHGERRKRTFSPSRFFSFSTQPLWHRHSRDPHPSPPRSGCGGSCAPAHGTDPGHRPPARCTTPPAQTDGGHVLVALQSSPVPSPDTSRGAGGLSAVSPRHRAAYLRGQGEQGCPAYRPAPDYQRLISLLGDKRHLQKGSETVRAADKAQPGCLDTPRLAQRRLRDPGTETRAPSALSNRRRSKSTALP